MEIALAIVAIIVVFVVFVATRPANFQVVRKRTINATPATIFPHLNDLKAWPSWSPWYEMEPSVEMTYSTPHVGQGASYRWEGKKTGIGNVTIVESKPGQILDVRLDFEKPMKATNKAVFELASEGNGTNVTWRMTGTNGFAGKLFGLIMNMDKMVGGQFDRGLEKLAELCEPKKTSE